MLLGKVGNLNCLILGDEVVMKHVLMRAEADAFMNDRAWSYISEAASILIYVHRELFEVLVLFLNQIYHN